MPSETAENGERHAVGGPYECGVATHRQIMADIADHQRGPGNLTLVAGPCVLGSQFVLIAQDKAIAGVLWAVSVVLWIVLIYGIFAALPYPTHLDSWHMRRASARLPSRAPAIDGRERLPGCKFTLYT